MKTLFTVPKRELLPTALAAACALAVCGVPQPADAIQIRRPLCSQAESDGGSGESPIETKTLKIQVVEPDFAKKEVAWLGVSTEEASDVLAAQLGLQLGDGLVVTFVQSDSPAALAGLQKNDVLVEFGDQVLVHPAQFRKLVRRQKEGDNVKLTLFRNGKKQTMSATLTKTTERVGLDGGNREFWAKGNEMVMSELVRTQLKDLHQPVAYSIPRQVVEVEVQRNVDEARKAIHDALVYNHNFVLALGSEATNVAALAKRDAELGGKTVTVRKNGKSIKTVVQADETGTYVIVANPQKRLTVHDKNGKLVFDGEIETAEQREKIPADILPRAQLMIEEMGASASKPAPRAKSVED